MDHRASLEVEFHHAMLCVADEAKKRRYYPTYFLRLVYEIGGIRAAKQLLANQEIQQGLMKLYELDLLHTSVEAYVIQDRFSSLFCEDERTEARRRLTELGYFAQEG
jgi:hypothetical protein